MQWIYCVEDDEHIRELIFYALSSSGFSVESFENYSTFSKRIEEKIPDLILLDLMLPDKNGLDILKEVRGNLQTKRVPIILLTAKSFESDKIKGLDLGADDYITKPFSVMELISRIKAVLRRTKQAPDETILYENITINPSSRTVMLGGEFVSLTYKEFELLTYLVKNKGIVLSRERLMNELWGYDFEGETRTVDVHIRTLRQKLKDSGGIIETVRNVGYKVKQ